MGHAYSFFVGGEGEKGLSILKKRLTAKPAEEKSRARGTMRASASIIITLIRLMLNKLLHRLKRRQPRSQGFSLEGRMDEKREREKKRKREKENSPGNEVERAGEQSFKERQEPREE